MKTQLLCGAAMALMLAVQPALAGTKTTADTRGTTAATAEAGLAQQDREFFGKAAHGGLMEVELGRLAQDKAASDPVRQFGQRMVADHSKANDKLAAIARQKGLEMPSGLDEKGEDLKQRLSGLSGAEFDRAYMKEMVSDHEHDIDLFQKQADEGKDADLRRFAETTLPTLKQHLELAKETRPVGASAEAQAGGQPNVVIRQQPGAEVVVKQAAAPAQDRAAASAPGPDKAGIAGRETVTAVARVPAEVTDKAATAGSVRPPEAGQSGLGRMTAKDLIGRDIVDASGKEIGEIEDLVLDRDNVAHVIVSVGGFLGIGEHEVAIPFERLQLGKDNAVMMSDASKETLKALPEYKKDERWQAFPRDRRLTD